MEKRHYIVLIEFPSKEDGIEYLNNSDIKFAFCVQNKFYSYLGELINNPENSSIFKIEQTSIKIYENPSPGQLFILDGFLQYYKNN